MTKKSGGPVEEQPVGGEENRIYARVHNYGEATAHDIEVQFHFSAPYHTVGGEGSFDFYKSVFIADLPAEDYKDVYVIWEPESEEDPHNCVRVKILRLVNDTNEANNGAQQNMRVISSDQASPYPEVAFPFNITNSEPQARLVYFRAEGVPDGWESELTPAKALLNPNQKIQGALKVTPKEGAPACTQHEIQLTAWTPEDHTIIPMGGATVNLQLRNQTEITHQVKYRQCRDRNDDIPATHGIAPRPSGVEGRQDPKLVNTVYNEETYPFYLSVLAELLKGQGEKPVERGCAEIIASGCTTPPRPNETVVLRYEDPAGNPIYKEVMTDENGCFEDFHVVVEGRNWETTAIYPGTDCFGAASSTVVDLEIDIPQTGDQDGDGLIDEEETQGDHDGDGIPNPLDPDSDNDGIIDGQEPPGDLDNDGLDNANDPDSDNDGIVDGSDNTPYGDKPLTTWAISAYYGWFDFDNDLNIKDNFTYGVKIGYNLTNTWTLEWEFGWTPTEDVSGDNGVVYNLNANLLYQFKASPVAPLSYYLTAGIGGLHFNGFSQNQTAFALNGGLGASYRLTPKLSAVMEGRAFYGSPIYNSPGWHLNYRAVIGLRIDL
jgi:hypothetical protein